MSATCWAATRRVGTTGICPRTSHTGPNAGGLVREFQVALARWLRLFEQPLAPGATNFTTPAGTRFIVVQVETDRPVSGLRLVRDDRTVDLAGRGRFWSGVVTGDCDGRWTVTPAATTTVSAAVFFGLRYDWALTAPNVCVEGPDGRNPRALLSLCRTTDLAPVAGGDVYDALPAMLSGTVTPSGAAPLALDFRRVTAAEDDRGQTYQAEIPVAEIREGKAQIAVQLDTLQAAGIPVQRTELTREITPSRHAPGSSSRTTTAGRRTASGSRTYRAPRTGPGP